MYVGGLGGLGAVCLCLSSAAPGWPGARGVADGLTDGLIEPLSSLVYVLCVNQEATGLRHLNVGELARAEQCYEAHDAEFDTHILDEDKVRQWGRGAGG